MVTVFSAVFFLKGSTFFSDEWFEYGKRKEKEAHSGSGTVINKKQNVVIQARIQLFSNGGFYEHDEGNVSLSGMWKALMGIENSTNSLISNLKVLQRDFKHFMSLSTPHKPR